MAFDSGSGDVHAPQVYLTAAEAFPAFEEAVLGARREIAASFRVFDPTTRLRSEAARRVGETWEDLLRRMLCEGVHVRLAIADFDPLARPELHRGTTRSVRLLKRLSADLPADAGTLTVRAALHPAELGWLTRLALWPMARRRLSKTADWLNAMPPATRADWLRDLPGLDHLLVEHQGRVRPARWVVPKVYLATHHQKLAVIDGQTLFIGGLDLNERRFDDTDHARAAEDTWHDVQLRVDGPVAQDASFHLARFEAETAGQIAAEPRKTVLTTLSRGRQVPWAVSPRTLRADLAERFCQEAGRARQLIYVETQFFRDRSIARALARAARRTPELNMIMILPAAPEGVAFDHKDSPDLRFGDGLQIACLDTIRKAFGDRLAVLSPAQPRPGDGDRRDLNAGAPIIYVHSKVAVFDDRAAMASSANLNGRSSRWDTEAGLAITDPGDVQRFRTRLLAHWLADDAPQTLHDPARAAMEWSALARANARREPRDRKGFLLPYPDRRARRFGRIYSAVPDEMV